MQSPPFPYEESMGKTAEIHMQHLRSYFKLPLEVPAGI